MKFVIIGGTSFIGREFVRRCEEVKIAYSLVSARSLIADDNILGLNDCSHVINFAGSSQGTLSELLTANVLVTAKIISELINIKSFPKLLVMGSAAEYGPGKLEAISETAECNPISDYGFSKYQQTLLMMYAKKQYSINCHVIRPFNVVGPNMPKNTALSEILAKISYADSDGRIVTGPLNVVRDYVSVSDVARCVLEIAVSDTQLDIINVSSGIGTSLKDIVHYAVADSNPKITVFESSQISGANATNFSVGSNKRLQSIVRPPTPLSVEEIYRCVTGC